MLCKSNTIGCNTNTSICTICKSGQHGVLGFCVEGKTLCKTLCKTKVAQCKKKMSFIASLLIMYLLFYCGHTLQEEKRLTFSFQWKPMKLCFVYFHYCFFQWKKGIVVSGASTLSSLIAFKCSSMRIKTHLGVARADELYYSLTIRYI